MIKKILIPSIFFIIAALLGGYYLLPGNEIKISSKLLFQKEFNHINLNQTYVINLDRNPERYATIKEQLVTSNIPHTRFSAVDGYKIKIKDGDKEFLGIDLKDGKKLSFDKSYKIFCPSLNLTYNANSKILHRTLSSGEFGCYCSHLEIWQEVVNKKIEYALILEDDAVLKKDFSTKLTQLLNHMPKEWDLTFLFLEDYPITHEKFIKITNNPYMRKIKANKTHISSTKAYLISYNGAKKLLQDTQEFAWPIDNVISTLINEKKVVAYKAFDLISDKNPYPSVIEGMGVRNEAKKIKRSAN
jgi:glycosyl transferase family 25